jgi:hypothetical protein
MIPHHSVNGSSLGPAETVAFSGYPAAAAPAIQQTAYTVQPIPAHTPAPGLQDYETLLSSLSFAMATLVLLAEVIRALPQARRRVVPVQRASSRR